MDNYLRIRVRPADKVASQFADWYINMNYIQCTASNNSDALYILVNNGIGSGGYYVELQNADGTGMSTADETKAMLTELNNTIFNAKPGQGVITLEGDFPYWQSVDYTQIF